MRCDALAAALSAASDGVALEGRAARHVESCLRCQAELVQYRKLIRVLRTLRTEVLSPGPSLAVDLLEGLEHAGERSAVRSLLRGRPPTPSAARSAAVVVAVGAGALAVALRRAATTPATPTRGPAIGARGLSLRR